ncbi:MAG: glycoside hydrolase family 172 protein [Candidatus Saccharimonadaceae bacterium]
MKRKVQIKVLLLCILTFNVSNQVFPQKQIYKWTDELELLKNIDQLPVYRSSQLVDQMSSYDRTGGNDDGFDGTYSYIRKENNNLVIADLKGPGVLNRIWTPTPSEDSLSFYFDGEKKARLKIKFSDLFSGNVFPFLKPVCGNEIGGYYCYIPIPYKESLKIVYHGEKILFHQFQYRILPNKNVESWTGKFSQADRDMVNKVNELWKNISPSVKDFATGLSKDFQVEEKIFTINPGEEIPFFESRKPGRIVGFDIDAGPSFEGIYKDVLLSATWDNEKVAAIYSPVADFFGYAYGKGAMRSMIMGKQGSSNYCYLPMPYDESANMKLIYKKRENIVQPPISVNVKVYYNQNARNIDKEGKFYSIWRRENPEKGEFYKFLELKGKGHYVGTIHQAQGLRPGMTLFFEGDDSTYIDGKMRLHGTGSEDYYNGGWYALLDRWDRGISLPIHGSLDYSLPMGRTGGYRFFLSDKMTFEKEIYHGMEHGPMGNEFPVDYISLAFYYGAQPLTEKMELTDNMREVYLPKEHIYFPQLMDLSLGGNARVVHDRGIRINTEDNSMVRVMLNDVPEGKYKVLINYFEKPDGADFQVWQRQNQLSEWISSSNDKELLKEKFHVGDIELTEQTNSITFHVRKKGDSGKQFELNLIILERIN